MFNAIYSWRAYDARKFGISRRVNAVICLAKCPRYFTVKSPEKRFYTFLLFLRSSSKYLKRRFSFEKLFYAKWNLFLRLYRLRRARRSVHSESYFHDLAFRDRCVPAWRASRACSAFYFSRALLKFHGCNYVLNNNPLVSSLTDINTDNSMTIHRLFTNHCIHLFHWARNKAPIAQYFRQSQKPINEEWLVA